MFDAWAAYDTRAIGTRYGNKLRRPPQEHTLENKNKAVSFAAHATLVSPGTVELSDNAQGFHAGLMTRDPDGHALLLLEE